MELLHQNITDLIIKSFYNVYNQLGYGFLEKVYENSILIELKKNGLNCNKQIPISVSYKDNLVGEYFADILVENKVIIELKAAESIRSEHEAQLLNYLKATNLEVGMLLNFGKQPQFKRLFFENSLKKRKESV